MHKARKNTSAEDRGSRDLLVLIELPTACEAVKFPLLKMFKKLADISGTFIKMECRGYMTPEAPNFIYYPKHLEQTVGIRKLKQFY